MIRQHRYYIIWMFVVLGLHSVVFASEPRGELVQLLRETYPQYWSGRIGWYYTPERNVVSDLREANVRSHEVVYFESAALKYVRGSFDFDGSERVSVVYDGELCVAFNLSGVPSLVYPDFNSLGRESAILVYIFLADPEGFVVEELDGQFIIREVSGFDVFFDPGTGQVNSVRFGQSAWFFDEYVVVDGCPWATRCRFVFDGSDEVAEVFAYARVESRRLKPAFFDYARFYKKTSYDNEGRRIIHLGAEKIFAADARTHDWPTTRIEWDEMMAQLVESQNTGQAPWRENSYPGSSSSFHFSYRALVWLGIFLIGTGLAGIILAKIRK